MWHHIQKKSERQVTRNSFGSKNIRGRTFQGFVWFCSWLNDGSIKRSILSLCLVQTTQSVNYSCSSLRPSPRDLGMSAAWKVLLCFFLKWDHDCFHLHLQAKGFYAGALLHISCDSSNVGFSGSLHYNRIKDKVWTLQCFTTKIAYFGINGGTDFMI